MFTLCFIVYASLSSTTPSSQSCEQVSAEAVKASVLTCNAIQNGSTDRICSTHHVKGTVLWVNEVRSF